MKIKKTLCELNKKEIKELEQEIIKLVKVPKFLCEKCVRVSADKKYLCKPHKLPAEN